MLSKLMSSDTTSLYDEAVEFVHVAIPTGKELLVSYLNGITISKDGADLISSALKQHAEILELRWRCLLIDDFELNFPYCLKTLLAGVHLSGAQLTVLDLSDNELGHAAMLAVANFLRTTACHSLDELNLANCRLGERWGKWMAIAILDLHRNCIAADKGLKLRSLFVSFNDLGLEAGRTFGQVVGTVRSLEVLDMTGNLMPSNPVTVVVQNLRHSHKLRVLKLQDNDVSTLGAIALTETLPELPNLTTLDLHDCKLGNAEANLIANVLRDCNFELQFVNFSYNDIKADGAMNLSYALQNKSNLRVLNLRGNKISYLEGVRIETDMIDKNPSVLCLICDEFGNSHGRYSTDEATVVPDDDVIGGDDDISPEVMHPTAAAAEFLNEIQDEPNQADIDEAIGAFSFANDSDKDDNETDLIDSLNQLTIK